MNPWLIRHRILSLAFQKTSSGHVHSVALVMQLLFLYLDHVAALGLSLAVADHVEKLVVGIMGFLVP